MSAGGGVMDGGATDDQLLRFSLDAARREAAELRAENERLREGAEKMVIEVAREHTEMLRARAWARMMRRLLKWHRIDGGCEEFDALEWADAGDTLAATDG